ncbi:hypothetical protein [Ruminococcus sp. Marseille-P6503]|uniref:hypothetical protein n=1 Tax=Ruminococcus sp. Marseille-P6503 TaxID=2364796 RepID=UPI000F51B6F9|nr:hypothetical protein [Ruminococcus sp. Marseille-P6503]
MKKLLASTLAILMTASLLTACGDSDDSSSSKADSSSAAAASTSSAADESSAAESAAESEAESAAESAAESSADSESEADAPKDISEMPETLKNLDNASFTFSTDMDVDDFVGPFAEDKGNGAYTSDTGESHVELSIEELEGIPMLRVQTLDKDEYGDYMIPKIRFDMAKLFAGQEEDLPKIFTIKMDIVTKAVGNFTADDGTESLVPGNFLGAVATQPTDGNGSNSWNQLIEFSESEWTSEWGSYEVVVRPGIKPAAVFADSTDAQYLSIMRWGMPNEADFYIADIVFEDEDGNVIECNYGK